MGGGDRNEELGAGEEAVWLVQVSESATRWRLFGAIVSRHAGQQAKPSASVTDDSLGAAGSWSRDVSRGTGQRSRVRARLRCSEGGGGDTRRLATSDGI